MAYNVKPVRFVKAADGDSSCVNKLQNEFNHSSKHDAEAGKNAREFYESIISQTATKKSKGNSDVDKQRKQRSCRKKRSDSSSGTAVYRKDSTLQPGTSEKRVNELLRHSQEGNLHEVKLLLNDKECSLEDTDQYGWNALMCAAFSGHLRLVRYFVAKNDSLSHQTSKKGQSALDLAQAAGHRSVVQLLEQYEYSRLLSPGSSQKRTEQKITHQEPFWCEFCQSKFRETSVENHQRSTSHLFSCRHAPKSTLYHIPESNRGFQMMLRDGWDKEKGLGREGTGPKFPVKTMLKRDRQGLGTKDGAAKLRITHFKPFDTEAVKKPKQEVKKIEMRASTVDKRTQNRQRKKQKAWEIDYRHSFYTQP